MGEKVEKNIVFKQTESVNTIKSTKSRISQRKNIEGIGIFNLESRSKTSMQEDLFESDKRFELSILNSALVITILENMIDKLYIIGNVQVDQKVDIDTEYQSLYERVEEKSYRETIFDPETMELLEDSLQKYKMIKFVKEIGYIIQILQEVKSDLEKKRTFKYLFNKIKEADTTKQEETVLFVEGSMNKFKLSQLKACWINESHIFKNDIRNKNYYLEEIQNNLEDEMQECERKQTFVKKWENSRNEQNIIKCACLEKQYTDEICKTEMNLEKEMRIHAEIECFIEDMQKDYENSTQMWMERYDIETQARDNDIYQLKEKRDVQFNQLEAISKVYHEHQKEIDEYLAYKEKKRLEEEEEYQVNKAAVHIQSWWRGVMVRKGLGRFRTMKGGKKEKTTGKGKNKKKK